MKIINTYYKNSNTGHIVRRKEFTETKIKGIPIYFFNIDGCIIEEVDLTGYINISEKKFIRESRKSVKNTK